MASINASRDKLLKQFLKNGRRKRKPPTPPTWPRNPRQDSFGNPTTKREGEKGTAWDAAYGAITRHPGAWVDTQGARQPRTYEDLHKAPRPKGRRLKPRPGR
jgi:hypothetical protein